MINEETIPRARGYFSHLDYKDEELMVSGWMFIPEQKFDSIDVYVGGRRVGEAERIERTDVASFFPFISNAKDSGFSLRVEMSPEDVRGMVDVSIVGVAGGRGVGKLETWYRQDVYTCLPVPPSEQMRRVVNNDDFYHYLLTGLQSYREFWLGIADHVDRGTIARMLDWGCGCGRLSGFFGRFSGVPQIAGCDIDGEAIEWCRSNLDFGEFSVIPPYPPTPYEDGGFDLVISYSVLTHLAEDVQGRWLEEVQRILAPGGLFLTTVHGEFATMTSFPEDQACQMLSSGIHDSLKDANLDGVAPEDYYRSVFQTKKYTVNKFSRYFEVLEYKERGALNFQDLVIMRKEG